MIMKRGKLIFVITLVFAFSCTKTNIKNKSTSQKAIEDFRYFVELLEDTHIDPYTAIGGKLNFAIRTSEFEQKINNKQFSEEEFPALLNEFISYLGDNHTWIDTRNTDNEETHKQLPFYCKPTNDAIYIDAIKKTHQNLYGAQLLSIENISIDSLLTLSSRLQPAENQSNLRINLCRQLTSYTTIKRLVPIKDSTLMFSLVTANMDTVKQSFRFMPNNHLNQIEWTQKPRNLKIQRSGIFSYQYLDDRKSMMYFSLREMFAQEVIEMMRANNANHGNWATSMLWYYPKLKAMKDKEEAIKSIPYFSESFRDMLEEMKAHKSKYLILDLTDNPGGYSELAIPALYMMYGDKCFSDEIKTKYIRRISQLYLDKYGQTLDQFNKKNGTNYRVGEYVLPESRTNNTDSNTLKKRIDYFEKLQKNNFGWKKYIDDLNGKAIYTPEVIVLTSAKTNSAAFHFLNSLYKLDRITVIGTAPMQAGNTPMEGTEFELPHSKTTGSISNSYQVLFPLTDEKAKIFNPDFPLTWQKLREKGMSSTSNIELAVDVINSGAINCPN